LSWRARLVAAAIAVVIHLALLGPLTTHPSNILDRGWWPESERILDGSLPYSERDFEYPPLAIPVMVGPAAISESSDGYHEAFGWEMIGFDLAIVLMLALGLRASPARVWGALVVYSIGLFALSDMFMAESEIGDGSPLALARFDLAPAAFVLAALLAREAGRSATWSALLATGTAIKAFPGLLFPVLLAGERRLGRVVVGALGPIALAAAIVVISGDDFGSAIDYHSDRNLQVETLGATPLIVAHLHFGTPAEIEVSAGSFNLDAPGAETARVLSIALLAAAYAVLIWVAWRRRPPPLQIAAATLAVAVALAPVLSPQFLLWLLPICAAAYGARIQGLLLVAACVLTQDMLSEYVGVMTLDGPFVWSVLLRNLVLVAFVVSVMVPLLRGASVRAEPEPEPAPAPAG
jgi:hypothetical protein